MRADEYEVVQGHVVKVAKERSCVVCGFTHPHLRGPQEHQGGLAPVCRYPVAGETSQSLLGPLEEAYGAWPVTGDGRDCRPNAIIADVDGTVADSGPCGRGPFDWDRVGEDHPQLDVINAIDCYRTAMGMPLIMMTGRMEQCRDLTWSWLRMFLSHDALLMRPDGDHRPGPIVKLEMYRRCVEPFVKVVAVFEDDVEAVRMWRSVGLRTYDVAGNRY